MKLGEVIKHRKGFIIIDDDKEYKLCRVQVHRKGVVLREVMRGKDIKTKKQQVCKAGDFLVAEMDAKVGGYGFVPKELDGAIVSSHYFLFELDEKKIRPKYLEVISKLMILQDQIKAIGSTNYAAIRPANVLNWEIPYIEIGNQMKVETLYDTSTEKGFDIINEFNHQQNLLSQLRKAFLKEALQGKLVKQDKKEGNATDLLYKIKAEKGKHISEKKLKKEQPLPNIKESEIPFSIPDSWVWCKLDSVCEFTNGKAHEQYISENGQYILVNSKFVSTSGRIQKNTTKLLTPLSKDNIAIVMSDVPTGRALGRCYRIEKNNCYSLNQRIGGITCKDGVDSKFLSFVLDRNQYYLNFDDGKKQTNLKKEQILSCPIPLPPLAEQIRIVNKLEEILKLCEELKTTITDNQNYTDQLLQVALKEALQINEVALIT